ncbi:MAG: S-layer homology domain-containing protein [Thermovenabulum sp.]|uniref:S-layer homology domain-containing protein n=1 Tax=Thermovenabulum sp. TaxID=3100335 RepID=UPI003C7DE75D
MKKSGFFKIKTAVCKILLVSLIFIFPKISFALPGYEGGIKNEVEYIEPLFITGEPVLLKGKVTVSEGRVKDGKRQDRISYNLYNEDKTILLTRSLTFDVTIREIKEKKQVIEDAEISRFSENITVKRGKTQDRFSLISYSFSSSQVTDIAPAVDYSSLNFGGRKVYSINRDEGEVVIEFSAKGVGYSNAFGSVEIRKGSYIINYKRKENQKLNIPAFLWDAKIDSEIYWEVVRDLTYIKNDPKLISFEGGYLEEQKESAKIKYYYDLPRIKDGVPDSAGRNTGTIEKLLETTPKSKRTEIVKVYDLNNHWAREDAEKLISLGIIEQKGNYFYPDSFDRRGSFAKALGKLIDSSARIAKIKETSGRGLLKNSNEGSNNSIFDDVSEKDSGFEYIESLYEFGVMEGTAYKLFSPDKTLTRAEAVTSIVRALGLMDAISEYPSSTGFADDGNIPLWAKKAVFIARDIGIVKGDRAGCFRPYDPLTKAESAALLTRLVKYLKDDIKKDFVKRSLSY